MILNLTKQQAKLLDKIFYSQDTTHSLEMKQIEVLSEIRVKFLKAAKRAKINL